MGGTGRRVTPYCIHRAAKNSPSLAPCLLPALGSPSPVPRGPFSTPGEEGAVRAAKGSPRVSRRPLPTPTPCEFVLLGILAWVGCWGAQIAATNWLAARGRLFKSACSTGARSLFGNFCRGKRARKELQSGVGFFLFFCFFSFFPPFHHPLLRLHPASGFTQNLRISKRCWQSGRKEVLGAWIWSFFFFSSISTFSPHPRGCSLRLLPVPRQPRAAGS